MRGQLLSLLSTPPVVECATLSSSTSIHVLEMVCKPGPECIPLYINKVSNFNSTKYGMFLHRLTCSFSILDVSAVTHTIRHCMDFPQEVWEWLPYLAFNSLQQGSIAHKAIYKARVGTIDGKSLQLDYSHILKMSLVGLRLNPRNRRERKMTRQ